MARRSPPICFTWGRCRLCFAWGRCRLCFAWGHCRLFFTWGRCKLCFTAGSVVAGVPQRRGTGYEERGDQETSSPSSTFAAGDSVARAPEEGAAGSKEGRRGQETTFPRSTCAAGNSVARTPEEGVAGYREGGRGQEITPTGSRSDAWFSLAGGASRCMVSLALASVGLGGGPSTMAATHGPIAAPIPGPGL
ncbi:UNVERIFIED_CONTAM: hypothetical protein FKN15_045959 [Acipenser sinensis]